jgi:type III secretory pathway component EscR
MGDYMMKRIHCYIGPLLLAAVIAAPALMATKANAQEASVHVRVYDRNHKDYHNWDDREDRAYRSYLTENHREYRDYNKQNRREQKTYWNWRHSHPDHDGD